MNRNLITTFPYLFACFPLFPYFLCKLSVLIFIREKKMEILLLSTNEQKKISEQKNEIKHGATIFFFFRNYLKMVFKKPNGLLDH